MTRLLVLGQQNSAGRDRFLRRTGLLVVHLSLLAVVGCDPGNDETVRPGGMPYEFQAGDTLVKMVGDPIYPGVAELVLELTIGLREELPEYNFSGIAEILPLEDGSVLVHDYPYRGATSLRHYDSNGRFLRYFGRPGEGPGEFRDPTGLTQLPDGRILFGDTRVGRINVFSPDGKVLDTWTLGSSYPTIGNSPGRLTADTAGVVLLFWAGRPTGDPLSDDRYNFLRIRSDGRIVDTIPLPPLPSFPESGSARKVRRLDSGGTGIVGFSAPYYPRSIWDLSPLGYFVTGKTDRYAVDLRIPDGTVGGSEGIPATWTNGQPVISIRRTVETVQVPRAERSDQVAYVQARLDRFEGRLENPIPPVPEEKPIFKRIQFGREGRIWVHVSTPSVKKNPDPEEAAEPGGRPQISWYEPTVYDVFEPDGLFLGRVAIPDGVYIQAMLGDTVWGVSRDELDIPFVHRYRIAWN